MSTRCRTELPLRDIGLKNTRLLISAASDQMPPLCHNASPWSAILVFSASFASPKRPYTIAD